MTKIKVKDDEQCILTFTHVNGSPAKYTFQMNPLTGDWHQEHVIGLLKQTYFGHKTDAVRLAHGIIKKSADNNLPCKIEIKKRTTIP